MSLKIKHISDTHSMHHKLGTIDNDDDSLVLVHSGDFMNSDSSTEIDDFVKWFKEQPFKYKILVPGNHDRLIEQYYNSDPSALYSFFEGNGIILLIDDAVVLDGVKFYGTPSQPEFNAWAFNHDEARQRFKYSLIPDDTEVLITHCPQFGIHDSVPFDGQVGSAELGKAIVELGDLKAHLTGHIHEHAGYIGMYDKPYISSCGCSFDARWKITENINTISFNKGANQ